MHAHARTHTHTHTHTRLCGAIALHLASPFPFPSPSPPSHTQVPPSHTQPSTLACAICTPMRAAHVHTPAGPLALAVHVLLAASAIHHEASTKYTEPAHRYMCMCVCVCVCALLHPVLVHPVTSKHHKRKRPALSGVLSARMRQVRHMSNPHKQACAHVHARTHTHTHTRFCRLVQCTTSWPSAQAGPPGWRRQVGTSCVLLHLHGSPVPHPECT